MRIYIFLPLFLLGASVVNAKGQLGIQLSPGISINRVHTNPNNAGFSEMGKSFCFKLGAVYDYPIQDRYYFSTGLLYAVSSLAVKNEDLSPSIREKHRISYIQLPCFLRLYTSELKLDTRLYVMLGLLGQVRIGARSTELPKSQKRSFIDTYRFLGCAALLGIGVEYNLSSYTSAFAGISYHYAWSSAIDQQDKERFSSRVMGYCDMLSLDLGVRF